MVVTENTKQKSSQPEYIFYILYFITLSAFFISSFFPNTRLWGINHWSFLPDYWRYFILVIGITIPSLMLIQFKKNEHYESLNQDCFSKKQFYIFATLSIIAFGCIFYLLRVQTYFLGDGYTVLSLLSSDTPLIKNREIGEALAHLWVKDLFGTGETAALISFQVISITSGVFFLIISFFIAREFTERRDHQIFLYLGIATGGFMLLFFGYVENYSIFVTSVILFILIGRFILAGRLSRWFIVPFFMLALFFHIMGITLLPGMIYILFSKSKISDLFLKLKPYWQYLLCSLVFIIPAIIFSYYYTSNNFFKFSILPVTEAIFTVENYTLFSFNHILDILNLIFILTPASLLFFGLIFYIDRKIFFKDSFHIFLLTVILSTLGAAFIFDPKLGMPRDWDLFAYVGIPFLIFMMTLISKMRASIQSKLQILILIILLGSFSLLPRAIGQNSEEISEEIILNYVNLDKFKNMNQVIILNNYFKEKNDTTRLDYLKNFWNENYKHYGLNQTGLYAIDNKKYSEALGYFKQAVNYYPAYVEAYLNIGKTFYKLNECDSSVFYFEIASGLRPHNYFAKQYLGYSYLCTGELEKSAINFKEAVILGWSKIDFDKVLTDNPELRDF